MSFRLQITGLNETINRLKKEGINIRSEVGAEVAATARDVERDASQMAPKFMGKLSGSISPKFVNKLNWEVVAQSQYAAFMEFGTKKKVKIPAGFEGYASQFRGQTGGKFEDLLLNIGIWIKRKGIAGTQIRQVKSGKRKGQYKRARRSEQEAAELSLAWVIASSIARNGVNPQPFMFPALMKNKGVFVERIKKVLDKRR